MVYRKELEAAGKPEPEVLPMMRECFVAQTQEEARRTLSRSMLANANNF